MPVKLRLQRQGRTKRPFYFIVAADSRAPRDGKYIERVGSYDPNTKPATINLDNTKALTWLQKGAQPTDTVRAILSYKGVLYKKHLLRGVSKGAMTLEQAEAKYEEFIGHKDNAITSRIDNINRQLADDKRKRDEAEAKKRAAKAAAAAPVEEVAEEEVAEAAGEEAPAVEAEAATEEAPVAEAAAEEAPAAEETSEEEKPAAE